MTAIRLKTPLPEGKRTVLIIMDRVARLTNLQYFVVGATARDILMYHLHGFPLTRASPDIDFAMAIENWPAFEALRVALLQEPTFRPDAKIQHRLHYSPAVGDGFPVDLVPFGGVEIFPSQVAWPPDMAVVMNVAGYAEALDPYRPRYAWRIAFHGRDETHGNRGEAVLRKVLNQFAVSGWRLGCAVWNAGNAWHAASIACSRRHPVRSTSNRRALNN